MIKKIGLFLMVFIVFFFGLIACNNSVNLYQELNFGNYKADIEDAEYLGIRNKGNKKNIYIPINKKFTVRADDGDSISSSYKENELVKINQEGDVESLNITDVDNKKVDLPYVPLYIQTKGPFSMIIAVHKLIFEEGTEYSCFKNDVNYFVPLLLTANDPISFMFNTGISDMGYHIKSYDYKYGSPLNLIIINNETGKVFDLSTTLFSEVEEAYGNQLYVDNLFLTEDKITFSVHYTGKSSEIIQLTYNNESDKFKREVYCPELSKKDFTPVLTDRFGNTLFISDSQFKILKESKEELTLPEEVNFRNSEYYIMEDNIYILTFRFEEYIIDLGKINNEGIYQKLTSKVIDVKEKELREFVDVVNVNSNNKYNGQGNYYNIENIGIKVVKRENEILFINILQDRMGDKSFVIDPENNEIMFKNIADGARHKLFLENKILYIYDNKIGEYNLEDLSDNIIYDNFKIINYSDNFIKYINEHIYFEMQDKNTGTTRTIYINIKTGEVYYDELAEGDVIFKEKIR